MFKPFHTFVTIVIFQRSRNLLQFVAGIFLPVTLHTVPLPCGAYNGHPASLE